MTDEPISADAGGAEAGYTLAMRPGTRLGDRYVVLRLLAGTSDFALTYLAHDSRSDVAVVAKELLPRGLVGRGGGAVRAHSADAEHEFGRVLRRFVREGELLLDLRHDALPAVVDVIEDHGTAYLVMRQHEALRLSDYLPTVGGRLSTDAAVAFTDGLLGALETLHAEGILHREVSPQTVHVRPDGKPLLLGLGAWRHVPGRNREPVAGFDPIEQYGGRDVGPWSDVYGAAAVLYYLVTGNPPASAIERAGGAPLRSPGVWARDVSPPMASAIVRGLALAPEGRPHSAAELRRHLEDATAMGAESSLPRAMAALPPELVVQPGPTANGLRDDDPVAVPFTLNSFGVVVPRNEGGVERKLKRVADVAARLRRRRVVEPESEVEPPREPAPASAGRRLDPVYDAAELRAPPPAAESTVLDPALSAVASETTSVVPTGETAVALVVPEQPTAMAPMEEPTAEVVPATGRVIFAPPRRRRAPLVIGAALVAVALLTAVVVPNVVRARGAADATAGPEAAPRPTGTPAAAAAPAVLAAIPRPDSSAAAPQGSAASSKPTSPGTAGATGASQRPPAASRPSPASAAQVAEVPKLPTISAPVLTMPSADGAQSVIAADLVVDARSRVSIAGEQADQGNYTAARQTLAAALARLDSGAARASDTESLRGVRREIEAAQKRTTEACGAESDLRRRHGQPPLSCP